MWPSYSDAAGGALAERWVSAMMTPAFAFWAGAGLAWLTGPGSVDRVDRRLSDASDGELMAVLVVGLVIVIASGAAVSRLTIHAIRAVEGYWPRAFAPLRNRLIGRHQSRVDSMSTRWQKLAASDPTPDEREELAALDQALRNYPSDPARIMPTVLGNILRSAESQPGAKYGLDAVICWPRLWLVLPKSARQEVAAARARLDAVANSLVWGLLFFVWVVWAWWAIPVAVVVVVLTFFRMRVEATHYADLVESVFDVHRGELFAALRWPLPTTPAEEVAVGRSITEYLWRGSEARTPTFAQPPDDC